MKARNRVRDVFLALAAFAVLTFGHSVDAISEGAGPERVAATSTPPPTDSGPTRRVVIRFLTDSDFPPFNFYDEDGVLVGFNVDLARAICLELGTSCDIKARPWEELFTGLKKGEADAVIAAHKVTASALKDVDFTDRYFHTPGRFAGRKDEPQVEMSPNGLDGKRIAVARGTAHEAFLKAFFRDSPLAIYENADLAREALAAGKADFIFDDGISLAFWLNGTLSRQCCEMRGGPFLEPKFFGDGIAIAVPKTDPGIRLLLNKALDRVRASGRFEELVQRYFPVRIY
ncbi:transporter substrate-binding domain-containing protein [Hyphomicrobium sp. 99]|uniref:transporter substrate-binding domain-containing protein n=1 Tax=Hyphomicrobium sp. 99 TaxID=1163419 RepID=UPI0005F76CEA|nr:transporter substrate-binding domain-containing protein [Hyphomicrobium sp. 99]